MVSVFVMPVMLFLQKRVNLPADLIAVMYEGGNRREQGEVKK
jgi:hypothetical protein